MAKQHVLVENLKKNEKKLKKMKKKTNKKFDCINFVFICFITINSEVFMMFCSFKYRIFSF